MITKYVKTGKVYTMMEELWVKYESKELEFFDFDKKAVTPRVIGRTGCGWQCRRRPHPRIRTSQPRRISIHPKMKLTAHQKIALDMTIDSQCKDVKRPLAFMDILSEINGNKYNAELMIQHLLLTIRNISK